MEPIHQKEAAVPAGQTAIPAASAATLREVVERLAPIDRNPCSAGEREAAEWIAERLMAAGAEEVALEDEPSWGTFPPQITALGALGTLAGVLALARRRRSAIACAAAAVAGILDEAQNGPRVLRRAVRRRRTTVNLIVSAGDRDARRTLVVLAHHDAPQTGVIFDQSLMIAAHKRWPQLIERGHKQLPQWWLGMAAPLAAVLTAASGRRGPAIAGTAAGALATALAADVWRSPTVPGANDNLSAVAAMVALAEMLDERPLPGVRVLLVSCGAEETLQDGIRAFVSSHGRELSPQHTWFLNLDTVGSPHLVMLEGEGPFWMERYTDPSFRDLVAEVAERQGTALERGFLARASTDSVIPSRAGYPSAFIGSLTDWRMPANYHLMSDVPQNLDYETIARATALAYGVAEQLAAMPAAASDYRPH